MDRLFRDNMRTRREKTRLLFSFAWDKKKKKNPLFLGETPSTLLNDEAATVVVAAVVVDGEVVDVGTAVAADTVVVGDAEGDAEPSAVVAGDATAAAVTVAFGKEASVVPHAGSPSLRAVEHPTPRAQHKDACQSLEGWPGSQFQVLAQSCKG